MSGGGLGQTAGAPQVKNKKVPTTASFGMLCLCFVPHFIEQSAGDVAISVPYWNSREQAVSEWLC